MRDVAAGPVCRPISCIKIETRSALREGALRSENWRGAVAKPVETLRSNRAPVVHEQRPSLSNFGGVLLRGNLR